MVDPKPDKEISDTLGEHIVLGTSVTGSFLEKSLSSIESDQPEATSPVGKVIPIDIKRGSVETTSIITEDEEQHYYEGKNISSLVSRAFEPKMVSNRQYTAVMRAHYLNPILKALEGIETYAGSPSAALYINEMMYRIDELHDQSPSDPLLEILFALYDALAYNNNWTFYDALQYREVGVVLKENAERSPLNQKLVEKAIIRLEELGFDTTPFELEYDELSSD